MSFTNRLATLAYFALFLMGCQNNGFQPIDFSEKQEFLHTKMVFEDTDIPRTPNDRDQDSTTTTPIDRDPSSDGLSTYKFGSDKEATEVVVKNPVLGTDSEMDILGSIAPRTKTPEGEGTLIAPPVTTTPTPAVTFTVPIVTQPAPVETVTTPAPTQSAPVVTTTTPKTQTPTPVIKNSVTKSPRTTRTSENDDTVDTIEISYLCSNKNTNRMNGNLLLSKSIKLIVGDCVDTSPSVRSNLINLKKLTTTKCQTELETLIASESINTNSVQLLMENGSNLLFDIEHKSGRKLALEILYNINSHSGAELNSTVDDRVKDTDLSNAGRCDRRASPLFVLMDDTIKSNLLFSSLTDGIMFDILGRRANYTKQQISWTNKEGMFFIALPDRSGVVKGVDQLFGDNTYGPDRRFAENGYEALRKWDDNNDGVINSEDAIYAKLRLWNDRDYNGVSNSSELVALEQMGVEVIDLNYDPNYSEVDRFGNKIMYKSVVRTFDQRLHLLFDVWFRYIPVR